jgi:ABC-type glycerol-3-phosphate transport system substrate-binding protein
MKKFISIMLGVILCLSVLLSCQTDSGNGGVNNNDTPGNTDNNAATTVPAVPFPEPDVPERDFGGVKFNVLYPWWGTFATELLGEEDGGGVLHDALWRRNQKIMGQVNIEFNQIVRGQEGEDTLREMAQLTRQSVMAGDGAYDLVFIHPMADLATFAAGQLIRNFHKIPYVDLNKPYWNQSLKDTLEINGVLLYAANDMIIPSPSAMLFNKGLIREYNLPDPYEFVREGTWTWDKFSEMARQVTRDLDGNGIFDENDLYGFSVLLDGSGMISMMHASDQYITRFDEDGRPVIDVMSERLVSLIDLLYDLIWVGDQTYTWTSAVYGDANLREMHRNFFPRGHTLFTPGTPGTSASAELRAMEVDFGILPYPKFNEAQQDYISLNHAGLMVVPADVKNPEMVGIVLELLGAESMRYTIPAYFDVLLTHQGVRDDDSLEMMNIIFSNLVYDPGYNFSHFTNLAYIVPRVLATGAQPNVASFYEANAPPFQRMLDDAFNYITAYIDLDY